MSKQYWKIRHKIKTSHNSNFFFILSIIVLCSLMIIGGSYAILKRTVWSEKKTEVVAGTLSIKYEDGKTINLNNTYPMNDTRGMTTPSYQFSVENTGTIKTRYEILLEEATKNQNTLDISYLRYAIKKNDEEWSNPQNLESLVLDSNIELDVDEKNEYQLRIWINENAGNETQGKEFKARIIVNAIQDNENLQDVTPPVIKLKGDLSVNVEENTDYQDLGVESIKDDCDDLTNQEVQITYEYYNNEETTEEDHVDTSKVGVHYIYYRISDKSKNEGLIVRSVNVYHKDTTPPEIALKGESLIAVEKDSEYVDEGAEATDQEEGNLTSRIVTVGTVNTKKVGTYTIKYLITDQSGNISSIVRVVNVIKISSSIEGTITLDLTNKKTEQLTITGENLGTLNYQSKSNDIASINETGLITANQIGTTSIIVTSTTGYKKEIPVVVQKTITVNFKANGNNLDGKAEDVIKTCVIKEKSCRITSPVITSTITTTIIGYSNSQTSRENLWKSGEEKEITDNATYYAQTMKEEELRKVTFKANGNKIDNGTEDIVKSCQIKETYNGVEQKTECDITTPTITAPLITPTVVGYNEESSAHTSQVGSNAKLTVTSTINGKIYYAITKKESEEVTATFMPQNAGSFQVTDLSGKNKHGGVYGNPKYSSEGLTLDGIDDYVNCGYVRENFEKAFTTIVKFKIHVNPPLAENYIIGNAEGAGMYLAINKSRKIIAGVHDETGYNGKEFGTIELNTWYEIAMSFDGNTIKVYLNGTLLDTYNMPTANSNMKVSSMPFYIGANPNIGHVQSPLNLTVQKAMIYKKVLDATEIKNIYTGTKPSTDNQLFYYGFTENRNKTVKCTKEESYNGKEQEGCEITAPSVNVREGYNFLGWNSEKNSHTASITNGGKITLKDSTTYYAISSKAITITYDKNNASAISKESDSCTLWNETDSCSVTSPTITAPEATPTVIGWSSGDFRWDEGTSRNLSETMTWYATTKADAKTYTATYTAVEGVTIGSDGTKSCTIVATYNGTSQATSCQVTLPSLTVKTGYNSPGFWATSNSATSGVAGGTKVDLTSNTNYYARALDTTKPIWELVSTSPTSGTIESTGTLTITFKGTDTTGSVTPSIAATNVTVKVGTTTVSPTTKNLGSASDVTNGKQYTLTLSGFGSDDGVVSIVIAKDTLSDSSNNKNVETTITTKVVIETNLNKDPNALYNVLKNATKGTDENIDFTTTAIDSGVYTKHETKNNKYPVYYYRGNVSNHVIFGEFCWRIVRTTETGGVKLVYNGTPTANNVCSSYSSTASTIRTGLIYNPENSSLAYTGYMYGEVYTNKSKANTSAVYGNDVVWDGSKYTLQNTYSGSDYKQIGQGHHYSCFSSSTSCTDVNYVYYITSSTTYYITLGEGVKIDKALEAMYFPQNPSSVKEEIDTWYKNNMDKYTSKLEDTVWCNDRRFDDSLNGFNKDGDATKIVYFQSSSRLYQEPYNGASLDCVAKNDQFTVDEKNGNGALTYPIGLLTADEANLAGNGYISYSSSSYLYTNSHWWLNTPYSIDNTIAQMFRVGSGARLTYNEVDHTRAVRPAISLKAGTLKGSGSGTTSSPYIVN